MSNRATSSRTRPPVRPTSSDEDDYEFDDDVIEISPRDYALSRSSDNRNNLRNELHAARNLNAHKDAIIALKDAEIQRLMENINKQNLEHHHNLPESSSTAQQLKEALLALEQKDDLLEAQNEKLRAAILKTSQAEMLSTENESLKKKLQKSEEAKVYFEDRAKKWEGSYQTDTKSLQEFNSSLLETQKSHHNEKVEWKEKMETMRKDNEKLQRKLDKCKKKLKKRSRKQRRRSEDVSHELDDAMIDNEALEAENNELKIDISVLESQQATVQQEKLELKTENTRLHVENVLLSTQNPRIQEENDYVKNVNTNLMADLRKEEEKNKTFKRGQEERELRKSSADRYHQSSSKRTYEHHDDHRERHRYSNDDQERRTDSRNNGFSDHRRNTNEEMGRERNSRNNSFSGAHWESCKRRRPDYQRH